MQIKTFGYYSMNLPDDYYQESETDRPSLVYTFVIVLEDNVFPADVASMEIFQPNGTDHWSYNIASDTRYSASFFMGNFSFAGRMVGGVADAGKGFELPVGTVRAVVTYRNGTSASRSLTIGVPDSLSTNGKSFIYAPDIGKTPAVPSVSSAALAKPTVTAFTGAGTDHLTVSFTVHGSNVHNGWVSFYDVEDKLIGQYRHFRDESDGTPSPRLNGGFNAADGGSNTLTVGVADIKYSNTPITSDAFSSISYCRINVVDGVQYEAPGYYASSDHEALSAKAQLSP